MLGGVLGWRLGMASAIGYYLVGMAGLPNDIPVEIEVIVEVED